MVWKRKKQKVVKKEIITEPTRRSILDILETNLQVAKRVIFVHRLIYVGEHIYPEDELNEMMKENFMKTNQGYCTEALSGVLLYYRRFFCHIVEGSEEILQRHLTLLFEECGDNLRNCKLLIAVHHINGRFSNDWFSYIGKPPERVEEIDPESDIENSYRYVKNCCEKLYNFANAFVADQYKARKESVKNDQNPFDDGIESDTEYNDPKVIESRFFLKTGAIANRDAYLEFLPELKLLDFLVHCKYVKNLTEYHSSFGRISIMHGFELKIWPLPYNYIPYNVFDVLHDPIDDLPTEGYARRHTQIQAKEEDLILAVLEKEGVE